MVPADFSHGEPSLNRKQRRADKTQSASGETALLAVALRHHQSGRLTEAEDLYRRILRHDPGHAQALHLSGLLAHQSGRTGQAIALIEQAIRRDPRVPDFHGNLGNALRSAGGPILPNRTIISASRSANRIGRRRPDWPIVGR